MTARIQPLLPDRIRAAAVPSPVWGGMIASTRRRATPRKVPTPLPPATTSPLASGPRRPSMCG